MTAPALSSAPAPRDAAADHAADASAGAPAVVADNRMAVLRALTEASRRDSRGSFDMTIRVLEAIVAEGGELGPQAQAALDQRGTVKSEQDMVRLLKTPKLRAAFLTRFEAEQRTQAEHERGEQEAARGKVEALKSAKFPPTGQIRSFVKYLTREARDRALKAEARDVLSKAPEAGTEGARAKLVGLIIEHPKVAQAVLRRLERDWKEGPKRVQVPKATREELEAHLRGVPNALQPLRGVLRAIAEGSMTMPLAVAVRSQAQAVLAALGSKQQLYDRKTDMGMILFALEDEQYAELCGVLKSLIRTSH